MIKHRALIFTTALALTLCACSAGDTPSVSPSNTESSSSTSVSSLWGSSNDVDHEDTQQQQQHEGFTLLPEQAMLDEAPSVSLGEGPANLEGWADGERVEFPLPAYQAGLYSVVVSCSNQYGHGDTYVYVEYANGVIGNLVPDTGDDWAAFTELEVGEIQLGMGAESIKVYAASDSGASGNLMNLLKVDFILLEADETAVDYAPHEPMTPERADEVYSYMQSIQFERYWHEFREHWLNYSQDERIALLQTAMDFAADMGIRYTNDMDAAMETVDWFYDSAGSESCLWYVLCEASGISNEDMYYYNSVYFYGKGLADSDYPPLHPDILAVTNSLIVQQYEDTLQLCTGSDSTVSLISKLTEDGSFAAGGSVIAVDTGNLDGFIDYRIYIDNNKFTTVEFGDADMLPALKAIGAAGDDGTLMGMPVHICAEDTFDAMRLYFLYRDEANITHITAAIYDEAAQQYVWDEATYTTTEMACFNASGDFCFIDEAGTLQKI